MISELELLSQKLDLLLAKLDDWTANGKPGMTQVEFARLIHVTPRTVSRMVRDKRVRLVKGFVPHATVRQFLS